MDPDENLCMQLRLARSLAPGGDWEGDPGDAQVLAELVLAMHEWLSKGGFLPKPWKHAGAP